MDSKNQLYRELKNIFSRYGLQAQETGMKADDKCRVCHINDICNQIRSMSDTLPACMYIIERPINNHNKLSTVIVSNEDSGVLDKRALLKSIEITVSIAMAHR